MSTRRSASSISTSTSSSTIGPTSTWAKLVWRRAEESKGEIRTSRWTPRSAAKRPYAFSPRAMKVADFRPASSPGEASFISTPKPRRSAHRRYMRSSISAQSCESVPPAPAWTVTTASPPSYSPLNSRASSSSASRSSTEPSCVASSRAISSSSPVISASSSRSPTVGLELAEALQLALSAGVGGRWCGPRCPGRPRSPGRCISCLEPLDLSLKRGGVKGSPRAATTARGSRPAARARNRFARLGHATAYTAGVLGARALMIQVDAGA